MILPPYKIITFIPSLIGKVNAESPYTIDIIFCITVYIPNEAKRSRNGPPPDLRIRLYMNRSITTAIMLKVTTDIANTKINGKFIVFNNV